MASEGIEELTELDRELARYFIELLSNNSDVRGALAAAMTPALAGVAHRDDVTALSSDQKTAVDKLKSFYEAPGGVAAKLISIEQRLAAFPAASTIEGDRIIRAIAAIPSSVGASAEDVAAASRFRSELITSIDKLSVAAGGWAGFRDALIKGLTKIEPTPGVAPGNVATPTGQVRNIVTANVVADAAKPENEQNEPGLPAIASTSPPPIVPLSDDDRRDGNPPELPHTPVWQRLQGSWRGVGVGFLVGAMVAGIVFLSQWPKDKPDRMTADDTAEVPNISKPLIPDANAGWKVLTAAPTSIRPPVDAFEKACITKDLSKCPFESSFMTRTGTEFGDVQRRAIVEHLLDRLAVTKRCDNPTDTVPVATTAAGATADPKLRNDTLFYTDVARCLLPILAPKK